MKKHAKKMYLLFIAIFMIEVFSVPMFAASTKVERLQLNVDDLTIVKGFKVRVIPEILPSTDDKKVVWTSSDDKVALVDKDGNITGIKTGSVVINCRAASGWENDKVNVKVIDLPKEGAIGSDGAYRDRYIPKLASKEFTVAKKDVKIYNERFNISIPKGFIYPNKIQAYVLKWMKLVEEASGLSFYPAGKKLPKISVTAVKGTGAYGFNDGIVVSQMDLLTDDSAAAYAYLHELSHVLDFRNSCTNLQPFTEGFAINNCYGALKLLGRSDIAQVMAVMNYWNNSSIDSHLDDFEVYYSTVDGWDGYIAGYIFSFYLKDKYGDNILTEIMKKWRSKFDINAQKKPKSEFIKVIKECTSKNVFLNFKDWYKKNEASFKKADMLDNDLYLASGIAEIMCLPIISDYYQEFPRSKFDKVDILLLDFYEAFFISQFYSYSAMGIFGNCYSSTEATISFYDPEWKFICSRKLDVGFNNIEVWGAARMLVKGDGGYFNFDPSFEKMMKK